MLDLTGYKLTFDDEFNTRSISQIGSGTTYADIRQEWRFDANSDIGFGHSSFVDPGSGYDPFSVQGGALTIAAVPDRTPSGYPGSWESGLITTQGNFSQKYGYFEVRADFSSQPGAWDAFWLMPDKQIADPNKAGDWQELDVVEHYGNYNAGVYSTIHTTDPQNGVPWQDNRQVFSETANPAGYHTYGVDWQADRIGFYVDGELKGSQATPSDMHSSMYMLANLATQEGASDSPISSHIDYIRVYSNDPNAKAVAQGAVSAPDGHDPGLYGAAGGTGNHVDTGIDAANALYGRAGTDTLHGGAGDDVLWGSSGRNELYGGDGNDELHAGDEGDFLSGGPGNDWLIGGRGPDRLNGDVGYDHLYGKDGDDILVGNGELFGGAGNDQITSTSGSNYLYGEDGNDTLQGGSGYDRLYGGKGDDHLDGGSQFANDSVNELFGGAGNDTIVGGSASDWIIGGTGSDILTGNAGPDHFVFATGDGVDHITDYSYSQYDEIDTGGRQPQSVFLTADHTGTVLYFGNHGGVEDAVILDLYTDTAHIWIV